MRTQLRIVAGSLKGRKITCQVAPEMRPTPQFVREALFSILGNAIPGRAFFDVFAGTGINGMEALSRGADSASLIERDFRLAGTITNHLKEFQMQEKGKVVRADAYRWAAHWMAPPEPVNVFLSPPFADLHRRVEEFLQLIGNLQNAMSDGSVLVIQSEKHTILDQLPKLEEWDIRKYGRNVLSFWVKEKSANES